MKAVNLIPRDSRRGVRGPSGPALSPTYAFLAALAVALVFVTIYVLSNNTISSRQAKLASLQTQLVQQQQLASTLSTYTKFEQLAQTRAQTVRQIAAGRFDWYGALSDLSKVVPANTSLASLYGSVAPGATIGSSNAGGGAGSASSLRSDLSVPAIALTGCTKTQDDVARLISRLRVINGVTRVTLGDSQKPSSGAGGTTVSSGTTGAAGCGPNAPTFDLVVFFQALPGGGLTGSPSGSSPATPATSSTPSSTPAAGTSSTSGSTAAPVAATTSTSGGSK